MAEVNLAKLLGSPQVQRWHEASEVKVLEDIDMPRFSVWNYDPCENHSTPQADCEYRACGGNPFKHQKVTATFSYIARKSMVGNSTGTGKTSSALLTLAIAKDMGERIKTVVVVPTISVRQWSAEVGRWTPGFKVQYIASKTPKPERLKTYASEWDLLIIGYHAFTRDVDHIAKVGCAQIVVDDVDPGLNIDNASYAALNKICRKVDMVIEMNATFLGTRLQQLYAASCLIGGKEVWGSINRFNQDYVKKEPVWIYPKKGSKGGYRGNTSYDDKGREMRKVMQMVGYKNLDSFIAKFSPQIIRYTYEDLEGDMAIPSMVSERIYLDMSPKQRRRYTELQEGVRTVLNNDSMPVDEKSLTALTLFTYGSQVCSSLSALKTSDGGFEPDGPEASPKLDWIMDKLDTDWREEKVVVYAKFKGVISSFQERLKSKGISYSTISGEVTDPEIRKSEMDRFWEDPSTRVMIISVSGERSLNLQVSRILVLIDLQLSPARVKQLAGRVRRIGSTHERVYVFQLLHTDSQEETYTKRLSAREELFIKIFEGGADSGEASDEMLIERLDPDELLRLISP